jgi:DNA-binding transcriptional ArsR family regulator
MSGDDKFNLEDFRLPPEAASERTVGIPKRIRKRHQLFVLIPLSWVDAVARSSRDKAFPVLCHLLHLNWKHCGGPVKVPNGFLARLGVGRDAKSRALRKLELLGLISVERRDRRSPVVRISDKPDGDA